VGHEGGWRGEQSATEGASSLVQSLSHWQWCCAGAAQQRLAIPRQPAKLCVACCRCLEVLAAVQGNRSVEVDVPTVTKCTLAANTRLKSHPPHTVGDICWFPVPFITGYSFSCMCRMLHMPHRDSEFLDMRCALAAFLWGTGKRAEAEDSWEQLQQASDGLGAALYSRSSAVERVSHRWPPRATAALTAFLALSDKGQAEGYDLVMHEYTFAS
jgi:hypothetical protein